MRIEHWIYTVPLRVRSLLRRRQVDRDLDEELRYHIERQIEQYRARGMSDDDARRAALLVMGGVELRKEECRDARGVSRLTNLLQDLRYGVRLLGRAPGFTAAAMLTVALGIGATTAIFSAVYGVVLRPLPFGEPARLVHLYSTMVRQGVPRAFVGAANARDWREQNHVFEDIALVRAVGNFNLVGEGEPERLQGARVSANLLPLLRVSPMLGRAFAEDDDEIGNDRFALLSYALWQRRFGGDPAIVGRTISLNGEPHTVVGVMGRDFAYPGREFELWTPLTIDPDDYVIRQNFGFIGVARLEPGVSLEQARTEMTAIAARLERQYPASNDGIGVEVVPMLIDAVSAVRTPLYVLLGAVGAMLLIGCVNLANLLLARGLVRRRELAVRAALGASRGRLMAQSVAELVPMLLIGGALGLVVAVWVVRALVPLLPADVPRAENIGIHLPVLAFAALALVVIALLAGVWPALDAARAGLASSIAELSRGGTGGVRRARVRDVLVVAQVATTLVLLVGAALLMRSFVELRRVDPGFDPDGVMSAHLAIPRAKYPKDAQVAELVRQVLERVRALPGVEAAGMVNRLPLAGGIQTGALEFEGADPQAAAPAQTDLRTVTPEYFRAIGIPLKAGRAFTDDDDTDAPMVGIIDERLARAVWPGADPLGRRFRVAFPDQPWITVVGVVGHVRHASLDEDSRPQVYWNYQQRAQDRMALVVRTACAPTAGRCDPAALAQSVATAVRSVDPEQPLYDVRTLEAVVDRSLARRRLQTTLLAVFASLALLLASIGVYGVMAYAVGQRLREFGIRMALGARRRDIATMVIRRALTLFAAGAAIGLLAASASSRVLSTLMYEVSTLDLPSFAVATLLLLLVGLAASWIPARRAARVEPTVALREE